jgi:hypothetical protein
MICAAGLLMLAARQQQPTRFTQLQEDCRKLATELNSTVV